MIDCYSSWSICLPSSTFSRIVQKPAKSEDVVLLAILKEKKCLISQPWLICIKKNFALSLERTAQASLPTVPPLERVKRDMGEGGGGGGGGAGGVVL